eukprot:c1579_g1_i1.p1 GENE.c1579_g1_i1~~c1579_g1_i1.p1  ORF type:complete len:252 (-),score=61.28 c1579_g1_i1:121-876(-)
MTDQAQAAAQVLGWFATLASTILFLSPIPVVRNIVLWKDVKKFSCFPWVVSLFQCSLWVVYAIITPDRLQPLVTNLIGVLLEGVYVALYFMNAKGEAKRHTTIMLAVVGALFVLIVTVVLLAVPHWTWVKPLDPKSTDSRETVFLGMICVVINIIMYGSPLSVLSIVIKTKSVEFMPLSLTVGTFLSSCMWGVYGLIVKDVNISIPNGSGLVLALIQFVVYGMYCSRKNSNEDGSVLETLKSQMLTTSEEP